MYLKKFLLIYVHLKLVARQHKAIQVQIWKSLLILANCTKDFEKADKAKEKLEKADKRSIMNVT